MSRKGIKKLEKILAGFLVLTMLFAFAPSVLAKEIITGRIQAMDRTGKRITISGTEYSLSDEAAQSPFRAGDDVEATVEGNEVVSLARLLQ